MNDRRIERPEDAVKGMAVYHWKRRNLSGDRLLGQVTFVGSSALKVMWENGEVEQFNFSGCPKPRPRLLSLSPDDLTP